MQITPKDKKDLARIAHSWTLKQPTLARKIADGLTLLLSGNVTREGRDLFYVASQTQENLFYVVEIIDGSAVCDCPDFKYNLTSCKHKLAAALYDWLSAHRKLAAAKVVPIHPKLPTPPKPQGSSRKDLGSYCKTLNEHNARAAQLLAQYESTILH